MERRSQGIDALRGIAIAMVVGFHFFSIAPLKEPIARVLGYLFHYGYFGVDVFFVISGFLLGGQLMDHLGEPGTVTTFYVRRLFRIWPLYLTYLAMVALMGISVNWIPLLTMTQSITQAIWPDEQGFITLTWTLSVEEQFYLLLPALIVLVPRDRMTMVLYALISASMALRIWLASRGEYWAAYVFSPCNASTLLLGVALAHATRYRGLRLPIFAWPSWLAWLGRRSYAVYLFHLAAGRLAAALAGGGLICAALAIVLTLIVAEAAYHLIEHPVQAWARSRWRYGTPLHPVARLLPDPPV